MNENSSSRDDIKTLDISELSSSAEVSTRDEIHLSRLNKMHFAKIKEMRRDHHLSDDRRYEKEYTWLHYSFNDKWEKMTEYSVIF